MQRSRDQLVALARRYYLDGVSQQELAKEFGVSRPTVASMLKQCREEGIVEIRIRDGSPLATALGEKLQDAFGLDRAVIVPSRQDSPANLQNVGAEAASFVAPLMTDGIRIGLAWGTSLYHLVHQLPPRHALDAEVIQLLGGLGPSHAIYDGQELARHLAHHLGARYFPLQSPILVHSQELKEMLLKEPGIRSTIERMEGLDMALVGVSSNNPDESALVRAGFLSSREAQEIYSSGAIGHICGYHYDGEGKLLDHPANQRIVGIAPEVFRKIPRRVGVACGASKAKALLGALRGGWLTDLVTDEAAALRLLGD